MKIAKDIKTLTVVMTSVMSLSISAQVYSNPIVTEAVAEKVWERCSVAVGDDAAIVSCVVGYKRIKMRPGKISIDVPIYVSKSLLGDSTSIKKTIAACIECEGRIYKARGIDPFYAGDRDDYDVQDANGKSDSNSDKVLQCCNFHIDAPKQEQFTIVVTYNQPLINKTVHYLPLFEASPSVSSVNSYTIDFFPLGTNLLELVTDHGARGTKMQTHVSVHPKDEELISVRTKKADEESRRDKFSQSMPLHLAVKRGDQHLVKQILAGKVDINVKDDNEWPSLHLAVQGGNKEMVELLLANHAEVNVAGGLPDQTPLHAAAQCGNKDIAQLLLSHKADVNAKDFSGMSPLYQAVVRDHKEVAELLIKHGADVNEKGNDGWTTLHMAARSGYKDILLVLLTNNADVNAKDVHGESPLLSAVVENHRDVAVLLLANKADVNAINDSGWSSLLTASRLGFENIVELLLANKAEVNVKDNEGFTPLHYAACNAFMEILKLLLDNKAEVNAMNNSGSSPLIYAAEYGHKDVVELLLANKADVNAKTKEGFTPLHMAKLNKHKEVIELLLQHGGSE